MSGPCDADGCHSLTGQQPDDEPVPEEPSAEVPADGLPGSARHRPNTQILQPKGPHHVKTVDGREDVLGLGCRCPPLSAIHGRGSPQELPDGQAVEHGGEEHRDEEGRMQAGQRAH